MFFNSVEFALFFPLVFILYWAVFQKNNKARNAFIVTVSYFFYGMWDWRFLSLIVLSSACDYLIGLALNKPSNEKKRKHLVTLSLVLNLGLLGVFKYFNFFIDSFITTFSMVGLSFSTQRLDIILPVGISFYTFQTLSYTLDIYNKKLEPTKNVLAFFAFVSFFPQLVAGPIERAKDLLPQFYEKRKAEYHLLRSGILKIVIGLFKKIVIADRLAIFVDNSYGNIEEASGIALVIGTVFFAFQLYIDFSAYSDIAIGAARTLGFNLSVNFKRPYLAQSFSDFWSRWHISLSTWFRDYLYIPLGGNRKGKSKTIKNVMIVFILSGLWHGASWNFVIWGALNGLFLVVLDRFILGIKGAKVFKAIVVSTLWIVSLVFFRAPTFADSLSVFAHLGFGNSEALYSFGLNAFEFKLSVWLIIGLLLFEIIEEAKFDFVEWLTAKSFVVRYVFYLSLVLGILLFGAYGIGLNNQSFIYFQF